MVTKFAAFGLAFYLRNVATRRGRSAGWAALALLWLAGEALGAGTALLLDADLWPLLVLTVGGGVTGGLIAAFIVHSLEDRSDAVQRGGL